jgi:DNA polymerase-3 subunit alpha
MGKKIFELIKEQRMKFVEGCTKNGINYQIAEQIFSFIEPFAGYGFNRSHAACYALIGYQTAYLKAHYPAEFMAALLTSDQDNIDRIAIEVSECEEMGIEVLPPNINESFEEFAVIIGDGGLKRIRFGLNAVKNVGHTVAREIVEERKRNGKYKNMADLMERTTTKDLNKKSLEALAKVGALDELGECNQILESLESILNFSKNIQRIKNSNQVSLFGSINLETPSIPLADVPPASKKQRLQWEKELLGLYVSDHPLSEYEEYLNRMTFPINTLDQFMVGSSVKIGGLITKVKKIFLKSQKTMLFVGLEDLRGSMELLVFPKTLERTDGIWQEDNIILAEGKLSDKEGSFKLLVDNVRLISPSELENFQRIEATRKANGGNKKPPAPPAAPAKQINDIQVLSPEENRENKFSKKKIIISLPSSTTNETVKELSAFFDKCKLGSHKIFLQIGENKLETPYCIKDFEGFKESLQKLVPEGKINIF